MFSGKEAKCDVKATISSGLRSCCDRPSGKEKGRGLTPVICLICGLSQKHTVGSEVQSVSAFHHILSDQVLQVALDVWLTLQVFDDFLVGFLVQLQVDSSGVFPVILWRCHITHPFWIQFTMDVKQFAFRFSGITRLSTAVLRLKLSDCH